MDDTFLLGILWGCPKVLQNTLLATQQSWRCSKQSYSKYHNTRPLAQLFLPFWAQSLFRRMGFKNRRKTSSALDIPDSSRKETEYVFVQNIVDTVERYKIPLSLILNLDQSPLKYVLVGNEMALSVTIEGSSDKRCITGTFAITTHGKFLPMHLIQIFKL